MCRSFFWHIANRVCSRADATINSKATGAMSWAFISAMTANSDQSYLQLLNSIRDLLESKYSQRPQMSASHPIGRFFFFFFFFFPLFSFQ